MRSLVILALLIVSAPVDARSRIKPQLSEPEDAAPRVQLGRAADARLDRVAVALHGDATSARMTLRFRLSTTRTTPMELRLYLGLVGGTVTGFRYALGGEPAIEAVLRDADDALAIYNRIVERQHDPALLRMVAREGGHDTLQLRVFPVTRGMPADVSIDILFLAASRVVFDPERHRLARVDVTVGDDVRTWTDVTRPRVLELAMQRESWMTDDPTPRTGVDETMSLFAGDEPLEPSRVEHREQHLPSVVLSDRRYALRRALREHAAALEHCYAFGVAANPQLSTNAELAVDIAAHGTVTRAEVTGELADDSVRRCIAEEIASWQLGRADRPRRVRQAIDLRDLR